jgi:hypothetical protein
MTRTGFRSLLVVPALLALGLGAAHLAGQAPPRPDPATLVLRNGRIVTLDAARPEAQAMAVRGDRIVALGTNEDIARFVGAGTEAIDLAGQLAVPGLIEGHGHFMGVGEMRMSLNLMTIRSWDEAIALVTAAAKTRAPGEWITGRGWHQEKWASVPRPAVEGFPTHASLSAATPDHPVVLRHASGHASFANARAMALAGVTRDTPNPPGGEILKDAAGEPIGVFRETAMGLVEAAYQRERRTMTPAAREAEARRQIALAVEESLRNGITSFQDAGSSFALVDLLKRVVDEGGLGVRLWVMIRAGVPELREKLAAYRLTGYGGGRLSVGGIKVSIDGALGPRGAWLLAPYSDLPSSSGLNTVPVEDVQAMAQLALQHRYQLCVHAIGDRANRETLDVFEQALGGRTDLRWRVEHAQHLHPADIPRFAKLGVVAAMQGIHCTSDAPFVVARLGEQRAREGAYVWRSLMKEGTLVTNGTDAPVEDIDPIASFHASVTRRVADGTRFYPEQAMGRLEALKSYTWNAAYSVFEEKEKGSLAPGKLADVTVLTRDILTVPEEEIRAARAAYTIVGGKVMYRAR